MPSCSVHHCVLFLLTLTLTTVPTMAFTSVMVNLNQPAVLPCEQKCDGSLKWNEIDEPNNILAQCNQTSCMSKEGFIISYDQYLKGNLSLIIPAVNYSNRGLYTCECDGKLSTVLVNIKTLSASIKLNHGQDLLLNLQTSEPVDVTYTSQNSVELYSEAICSVTEDLLQCKDEYNQRVSLTESGSHLIVKKVKGSDSGVYSVWDPKYNGIYVFYAVIVEESSDFKVRLRLHESGSLPCTCSDLAKWTHNKDDVALCNQKSCTTHYGYSIFHDNYLRGDFSLKIDAADYCMRGWYTCSCYNSKGFFEDMIDWHVIIEPENTSVHLKSGEDLILNLIVTEPVEVFYYDYKIYPNVPRSKPLLCKDEHRRKMSHSLKLGTVNLADSGVYTIREKDSKDVLHVYNVTVKDHHPDTSQVESFVPLWVYVIGPLGGFGLLVLVALAIGYLYRKRQTRVELNADILLAPTQHYGSVDSTQNSIDPSTSGQLMESPNEEET